MNDYDNLKSLGQKQAWNIAKAVLEETGINPLTADGELPNQIGYAAYSTFLRRLKEDPLVRQDLYTSQRIIKKEVATSYINWLIKNGTKRTVPLAAGTQIDVDFNRIAFHGSSIGCAFGKLKVGQRIYQGGSARATGSTARAALTLANGDAIPVGEMRMNYLTNSRILCVLLGNHRAIAYKLLGVRNFPAQIVDLCDDSPNEELNRALLYLEGLYTLRDPRETKIEVTTQSDVELAIQLAKTYKAAAAGSKINELYSFTKRDLLYLESKQQAGFHIAALELLKLYTEVYQTLPKPKSQAWWQRFFQREDKRIVLQLPSRGQDIRERWLNRRALLTTRLK